MKLSFAEGLKRAQSIYAHLIRRESALTQVIDVVELDGELLLYDGKIAVCALFDKPMIYQYDSLRSWRTMPDVPSRYTVIAEVSLKIEYDDTDYDLINGITYTGYIGL